MGYSILLLTRYERKGASSRVRHYNYLPALERAGFQVTTAPFLQDEYLERLYRDEPTNPTMYLKAYWRRLRQLMGAQRYDLIWIEKEALPWIPAAMERPFFGRRPIVVDFDDPWHLRYAAHRRRFVRAILGAKLETIVAHATTVVAGSPMLEDWARSSHAPRVVAIPSVVDLEQYPVSPLPDGPFTVGWIGTPRNEAYLHLIAEPLRHLHEKHGARLRVISGGRTLSLPGVAIDTVSWSEHCEAAELARCHIGIMPLFDEPWERGKCGYKLIQYMAAARPVVASPVGANRSIVVPGQTGFFASSAAEWTSVLSGLAADRERVRTLGLAARRRAETEYSLQANAPRLVQVFNDAIAANRAIQPDRSNYS